MKNLYKNIKSLIIKYNSDRILIHSDVLFGFKIKFEDHKHFLESHTTMLKGLCEGLDIWMPAFNYDFCKGKTFDVKQDVSQVGNLSEYFRSNISEWRSPIPVFSFAGLGVKPTLSDKIEIDPFDGDSLFAILHRKKGLLMHYGSGFHTTTLIHYVERISEKLFYRYDKVFKSDIIDENNIKRAVNLNYHVRPLGYSLGYDWKKLEQELIENNLLFKFKEGRTCILIGGIEDIVFFWLSKLNDDPLYFLDDKTRLWVDEKLKILNRPFLLTDFE
ncbi:AAC(3) family N-acetyltransferase [Fulvivirgaceae bacterium BMA12]|uniref:Aminoglycoside N(3)-acetyltransferase n=1 Tax=Agaribacillus aureus TaxID=3051825 RepID=A0ABT8LE17_9BACT|nr:AAC(3) family N-acetyltransferase [Fulvivirgaceae bacterium BMA12]